MENQISSLRKTLKELEEKLNTLENSVIAPEPDIGTVIGIEKAPNELIIYRRLYSDHKGWLLVPRYNTSSFSIQLISWKEIVRWASSKNLYIREMEAGRIIA